MIPMRTGVGVSFIVILGVAVASCAMPPRSVVAATSPGETARDEWTARRERRPGCEQQARDNAISRPYQRASFVWKCVNR
jgi:hypothetical protein